MEFELLPCLCTRVGSGLKIDNYQSYYDKLNNFVVAIASVWCNVSPGYPILITKLLAWGPFALVSIILVSIAVEPFISMISDNFEAGSLHVNCHRECHRSHSHKSYCLSHIVWSITGEMIWLDYPFTQVPSSCASRGMSNVWINPDNIL